VLVELTDEGRKLWEEAFAVQAEKEALLTGALNARDRKHLNNLLRLLMLEFERRGIEK
jgi:DNA-binding MarR family transcriptional regulator